jgi:hypothetical protein
VADTTDPQKLSSFVNSIIDRKIKPISISFIAVAGTLRDQATQLLRSRTFQSRFSRGANTYGSWEIRPGVIEMWGRYKRSVGESSPAQAIAFPLILPDTTFNFSATPIIASLSTSKDFWVQITEDTRTVAGVTVNYQTSNSNGQTLEGFDWRVIINVDFAFIPTENAATPTGSQADASGATKITGVNVRPADT